MALAEARRLLGVGEPSDHRLDASLLEKVFEPAVEEQCENRDAYDLEVNCAVLKIYAMHPLFLDTTIFKLILSKALMQLPKDHFTLALYTAPHTIYSKTTRVEEHADPETKKIFERSVIEEAVFPVLEKIVQCGALLRSCRFQQFWQEIETSESLAFLYNVDGFVEAIRTYIISVVIDSHRAIQTSVLARMLGLDPKQASGEMNALMLTREDWESDGRLFRRKLVKTSEASSK